MTNGILRFNTNTPVAVALRWDDGRRVEGKYGEQVMYTLDDDRVMYVPPVVANQIRELGIRAREVFEICKAELREENKRWIEWPSEKQSNRGIRPRRQTHRTPRQQSRAITPRTIAMVPQTGISQDARSICKRRLTARCCRFRSPGPESRPWNWP